MNGDVISERLMKVQGYCPNCGTTLTFMESAQLAKQNGITEDAVMCHNCHKVFTVNLTLEEMSFVDELIKESGNRDFVGLNNQSNIINDVNRENNHDNLRVNQGILRENPDTMQQNVAGIQQVVDDANNTSEKDDEELNSIFGIFFYKKDKRTGKVRISKTKTISFLAFISIFIILLLAMLQELRFAQVESKLISVLVVFVIAAVSAIIIFLVGYLISYILDK